MHRNELADKHAKFIFAFSFVLVMKSWSDERIWSAVDDWRLVPPSAKKVSTDDYELVVTPGSYALN